jgi:hypothetical protein
MAAYAPSVMIGSAVKVHITPREGRILLRESRLRPGQEPPLGSHLVRRCAFYSHHGIYAGDGRVIHYAGFARGLRRGPVEEVSLEHFAHGRTVRLRDDRRCFDCRDVVERARSRLGEDHYHILKNNCEHFCAWALRDETRSPQVERLRAVASVVCGWIERLHLAIVRAAQGQQSGVDDDVGKARALAVRAHDKMNHCRAI